MAGYEQSTVMTQSDEYSSFDEADISQVQGRSTVRISSYDLVGTK